MNNLGHKTKHHKTYHKEDGGIHGHDGWSNGCHDTAHYTTLFCAKCISEWFSSNQQPDDVPNNTFRNTLHGDKAFAVLSLVSTHNVKNKNQRKGTSMPGLKSAMPFLKKEICTIEPGANGNTKFPRINIILLATLTLFQQLHASKTLKINKSARIFASAQRVEKPKTCM